MNFSSMGASVGVIILSTYWVVSMALAGSFKRPETKEHFLAAGRTLGVWESAFSIAATWIWAPALFLASQKAYSQGWVGVFWFTVPNILCLIVFAPFARMIRERVPDGFTLSDFMRTQYSNRVQSMYLVEMTGLAACSFAVQLLAGGKVLSFLTGLSFIWVTIALAFIALSYSLLGGLKSSVVTDYLQMALILLVGGLCTFWVLSKPGSLTAMMNGLGGRSGEFTSLFSGAGGAAALSFGLPVTIGLMAGPFGDQSFYQRAFAVKKEHVGGAFIRGALLFGIVPVMMSALGFVAAGHGWNVDDPALVNLDVVLRLLPSWMVIPFTVMLLSGLVSTLDSNLCAVSSIVGHDFMALFKGDASKSMEKSLLMSRAGMLALAGGGLLIANIPGMKILYLFLFYGTLRASTLLPTVLTLLNRNVKEAAMFYGILFSIAAGLPVFAYGNFTGRIGWTVTGSLITVGFSGLIVCLSSLKVKKG